MKDCPCPTTDLFLNTESYKRFFVTFLHTSDSNCCFVILCCWYFIDSFYSSILLMPVGTHKKLWKNCALKNLKAV